MTVVLVMRGLAGAILVVGAVLSAMVTVIGGVLAGLFGLLIAVSAAVGFWAAAEALLVLGQIRDAVRNLGK